MARKTPRRVARKAPRRTAQSLRRSRARKAAKVKTAAKRSAADHVAAAGALPQWTTAEIEEAFRRFKAASPEPKGELKLDRVVPAKYKHHAHHWLILHGRYVCLARRPLCERCLIADLCKWPGKTVVNRPASEH